MIATVWSDGQDSTIWRMARPSSTNGGAGASVG